MTIFDPVGIYMFKVNDRNTKTRREMFKVNNTGTRKTPVLVPLCYHSGVFIVNFQHISHLLRVYSINFEHVIALWGRMGKSESKIWNEDYIVFFISGSTHKNL